MTDFKTIRTNLNASLQDIGTATGVGKQYVHDIETGKRPMSDKFKGNLLLWLKTKQKIIQKIIKLIEKSA